MIIKLILTKIGTWINDCKYNICFCNDYYRDCVNVYNFIVLINILITQ